MPAEWVVEVIIEAMHRHGKWSFWTAIRVPCIPVTSISTYWKTMRSTSAWMVKAEPLTIFSLNVSSAAWNMSIYLYVHNNGNVLYSGLIRFFEFYIFARLHQSLNYETPAFWYMQFAAWIVRQLCGELAQYHHILHKP
jgi:hypothetical protein